jgi:hypothetical protein
MNAAVYAVVGFITNPFNITLLGVRFWPSVIVPGTFAVLFGPWVGGFGAAIGIFLADVMYGHGNALVSILVGVPSNFGGFFIVGVLGRLKSTPHKIWLVRYVFGSVLGLGFGTLFIGFGLMAVGGLVDLTALLLLPGPGDFTIELALFIAGINFLGEIPFLLIAPLVILPVQKAFPSLFAESEIVED